MKNILQDFPDYKKRGEFFALTNDPLQEFLEC